MQLRSICGLFCPIMLVLHFNLKINKPGGLDGLRGVWLALRMVIALQLTTKKSQDSNPRPCTHHHWPPKSRIEPTIMHYYTTIDPKSQRFEPTTMHYTTIDWPPKSQFEPTTMHSPPLTPKVRGSNQWPCTNQHWPPKSQRFDHKTMHYTTTDPNKLKIRTHNHALHHHWHPKTHRFEPNKPYTTPPLTPKKTKIWTHDHSLHHRTQKGKDLNPQTHDHALHHRWPSKRQRFEPKTMHSPACTRPLHSFGGYHDLCTCTLYTQYASWITQCNYKV
jgi:hypothetical protein